MKYKKIVYPDGQIGVELLDLTSPYEIHERINSYEDLFFIKSIVEALNYHNVKNIHLRIPCLFGQRSDRRFMSKNSFDLKIITDFINSCNFMSVEVLDPHSDVSMALLNQSVKKSPTEYIGQAILDIGKSIGGRKLTIVSPDAGAYKKAFELGVLFNLPVVAAVKHRDLEGKVDLQFSSSVANRFCLIVDDLCDGGYTFVTLAEQLKKHGASMVFLYVTHGYFAKGFNELLKNINWIYCTNSVKDIQQKQLTQFKTI
jgi:ribose-phosphate pyrophosphokinase